jgi:hypothetical protein
MRDAPTIQITMARIIFNVTCLSRHSADGPKHAVKIYEVHHPTCEY